MCVCTLQLLNPTQHTLLSDLGTSKLHFLGSRSWQNVHVLSQTVRTCMQIPCTHEAPFTARLSSVPHPQLSALTRPFWYSKLTAWIRLWHIGRSTLSCAHKTACVRACENTVTYVEHRTQWRCPVPSKSHCYDVPEVEFKKMTPILREFCLTGLKQVFVVFCKFQVVLNACQASLWSVNRDWQRRDAGRQTV